MPNFTFYPDIPQPDDNPAESQNELLTNFSSIGQVEGEGGSWVTQDHYGFGTSGGIDGLHKQVTFAGNNVPSVPSSPPVLFTNTVNSIPQLFWYSGSAAQGSTQYYSTSTQGSTMAFGGIIIKWGGPVGSPVVFMSGAGNVPFPNNIFSVVCTPVSSGSQLNVTSISKTGFSTNNASAFYWIAIGN